MASPIDPLVFVIKTNFSDVLGAAAAASLLLRDVAVLGVPVVVDLQRVRGNAGSHPEEEKLFLTIVAQMHML